MGLFYAPFYGRPRPSPYSSHKSAYRSRMSRGNGERNLLRAVAGALLAGLLLSTVAAVHENGVLAFLIVPALAVFWAWVALGTICGLMLTHRWIAPLPARQANAAAFLAALLCGAGVFTGAHEPLFRSLQPLFRFNPDLIGYHLVGIQLAYFGAAALASFLSSAALACLSPLRAEAGDDLPDTPRTDAIPPP